MTIQEIKNTPEIVDFMLDGSVIADSRMKLHKRLEEICELAIKALEQQPCGDTISRQAAIDALMKIIDKPKHAEFLYTDEICRVLKALPSAEPERKPGEWILEGNDNVNE